MEHATVFIYVLAIPALQVFAVGVMLWIGTRMTGIERSGYRDCLVISLIVVVVGTLILALTGENPHLRYLYSLVHFVLPVVLVKWHLKASWLKSILVGVFVGACWLLALQVLTILFLRFIP